MTTGVGPYVTPVIASDPVTGVLEATIVADETAVDIGIVDQNDNVVLANALTFNGAIPGPTLRLNAGDTAIVRLINQLEHATGIHWHGIELENAADGTPFTQNQTEPDDPAAGVLLGRATYLYKFKARRPGLYWYHPHHHSSSNQVFKGLYGMMIVADPNEAALIAAGVLPGPADTVTLVLSDTTVCKAQGSNDPQTYDPALPWVGGGPLPVQPGPTPEALCETDAIDEDGADLPAGFAAGDIPNIQNLTGARTNEGQTVLTNGVNVGDRAGTPAAPGDPDPGAATRPVLAGQGLRLQIVNAAAVRYFRLLLTDDGGQKVNLVRVGGEGELLNKAVVDGGVVNGFDTKYTAGEILLPPGSRADVVAVIPANAAVNDVLTLWTQDYSRTGQQFARIPTVPVMHLSVTGAAATPYAIAADTPVRTAVGASVEDIRNAPNLTPLRNPATFVPAKPGMSSPNIRLTQNGMMTGIDGIVGTHDVVGPYTSAPHMDSSRYAKVGVGDILELTVENTTAAHHPFHLHGFSMQPISLTRPNAPSFIWPDPEFRDNIDVPANHTLTFRIRIDDRELADGVTLGGAFGRWLFHCHIFFHAHLGMISELVATAPDGNEKPNVNVIGSWAYAPSGGAASRQGFFSDPDGDAVTLKAHLAGSPADYGVVTDNSDGTWSWAHPNPADGTRYVYITATDAGGRQDQTVFRLKVGGPDDGADNGDPHITTVNGKYYDFQAVGEFTLLRDAESGFEVQARQTPVPTANPVTDPNSGLKMCVSVNTAVAARIGGHRIAYQPSAQSASRLQFFVDGKPAKLPTEGMDLGTARVTAYAVDTGATAVRVDCPDNTVLTVTPRFWNKRKVWLMDVSVAHTAADRGIMGAIPKGSWLPALPNGATLGPKPAGLHERYVALYRTFADAWRVTDETSLFVYAPGTSTETFTDRDWPAEKPPCQLKPQFQVPGAQPLGASLDLATAKRACKPVVFADLNRGCVFDVATTGDKSFVKSYLLAQDLRLHGTAVQLVADKPRSRPGEAVLFTAIVSTLTARRPTPAGSVRFLIDGRAAGPLVPLDKRGRARLKTARLKAGTRRLRAVYAASGKTRAYRGSSSPTLLHAVGKTRLPKAMKTRPHTTETMPRHTAANAPRRAAAKKAARVRTARRKR